MKKHMHLIHVCGKWEVSGEIHINGGDIITVHFGRRSERDTVAVKMDLCGSCVFKKAALQCMLRKGYNCGVSGISLIPIDTLLEEL